MSRVDALKSAFAIQLRILLMGLKLSLQQVGTRFVAVPSITSGTPAVTALVPNEGKKVAPGGRRPPFDHSPQRRRVALGPGSSAGLHLLDFRRTSPRPLTDLGSSRTEQRGPKENTRCNNREDAKGSQPVPSWVRCMRSFPRRRSASRRVRGLG